MAEKDAPAEPKKSAAPKKAAAKKAPAKKAAPKAAANKKAQEHVTIEDMHKLLGILQEGLASRDKAMDYLVTEITLNQQQIEQNKKILAKRGTIYKFVFVLLAIGVISATYSQHTVIKSFDVDMTNVSNNMDVMRHDMSAMRIAMEAMSADMHSMSGDFSTVAKDVSTIAVDVKSMSHGVRGMSYDTREMNRSMDTMTPPWSPFR